MNEPSLGPLKIKSWSPEDRPREKLLSKGTPVLSDAELVAILLGFLFQWPTIVTLAMFPVLLVVYWRLAIREEREVRERFGAEYDEYAEVDTASTRWWPASVSSPTTSST